MSGQNAVTALFTTCLLSYCEVFLPYDVSANDVSVVEKVSFYLFCLFCNCAKYVFAWQKTSATCLGQNAAGKTTRLVWTNALVDQY